MNDYSRLAISPTNLRFYIIVSTGIGKGLRKYYYGNLIINEKDNIGKYAKFQNDNCQLNRK